MDFTGERLVLGKKGIEQLEMEHLHRYNIISDLVKDKIVLDIACGTGYGSHILSQNAKYVYGVDISKETIDYCNENYKQDNLSYMEGSISEIPIEDNSIDVIVSFETIEHVTEELQEQFLREIPRVLKEDGVLIISTPDKKIYSDIPQYTNEFHIKEFYKEEFKNFLSEVFKNVKFYYQGLQICDVIDDGTEQINKQIYLKKSENKNLYPYIIAVCSNSSFNEINLNSFALDKDNSLFLMNRKFDSINNMLVGDDILSNQKNIIEQKENYIEEQREIIEQKEGFICEQRGIIEQKENYICEQREIIEQKEGFICEQRGIIEQKENYICEQREIIEQKENYICEQRENLNKIIDELNKIKSSKYYKIYEKMKRVLGRKS
ncbi:Methyltransferase domain-containing protein [Clostridium neonatale]|uniref:class I SAM-dependent methyltransferase n=1 Tax=Clostridium neonatale TaxID=137838 RepID=UPI00291BB9CB|nr:methyltransferase domain-containing protein [Clostridium neonatale]CAI3704967.1 Methyltransferase domain-containing protein [Clostridium neonatale]